ncbi:MAG: succinate dehydrogenase cytochrome b subunit [Thermodesulfobacteriota bacterium]
MKIKGVNLMNWLINMLSSSIGKKLCMAVTGICFCLFLAAHLAGNLTMLAGPDAFVRYAEKLHSLGFLLTAAETGLLVFAVIHVLTGAVLTYGNFISRPTRYQMKKGAGGRSIGSATMPYTGFLLLLFVILHLLDFHFVDKTGRTIFQIVSTTFQQPVYVGLYIAAMVTAALHVSHGLWSAFQTMGVNHPKYTPVIRLTSVLFSLAVGVGFGFLPVYLSLMR